MISRGDIYYADLSPVIGSEQGGIRPVLVLQNNKGNKFSTTVIVAPISSKLTKNPIPTHVIIRCDSLEKKSVILLEQIRTIDKVRFQEKLGTLDDYFMKKVNEAIKTSLDLKQFSLNIIFVIMPLQDGERNEYIGYQK